MLQHESLFCLHKTANGCQYPPIDTHIRYILFPPIPPPPSTTDGGDIWEFIIFVKKTPKYPKQIPHQLQCHSSNMNLLIRIAPHSSSFERAPWAWLEYFYRAGHVSPQRSERRIGCTIRTLRSPHFLQAPKTQNPKPETPKPTNGGEHEKWMSLRNPTTLYTHKPQTLSTSS